MLESSSGDSLALRKREGQQVRFDDTPALPSYSSAAGGAAMEESPIPSDTTHRTLAACRTRLSQCFRFSACEGCHVLLFWHAESLPLGNLVSSWQRTTSLVTELLSNCFQQFQPIPINTKSTPCAVPEASHPRAPDPARPLTQATQATLQADGEPRRETSGPQGWFAWRAAFTPNHES